MTELTLNRLELAALLPFATNDITRPNIAGLWFDFARGVVYATDGHTIAEVCAGIDSPGALPIIVPVAIAAKALKLMGKESRVICKVGHSALYVTEPDEVTIDFKVVKNVDPVAFGRIFPDKPARRRTPSFALQPKYMARLDAIQKACDLFCDVDVPSTALNPIVFRFGTKWRVAIMPCAGEQAQREREARRQKQNQLANVEQS